MEGEIKDTTVATETTGTDTKETQTTETKTFTQEELNRVASREKKQGETAILKELGLSSKEDLASIKEILAAHEQAKASKMTVADLQKALDDLKSKSESEKAAVLAEAMQAKQEAWVAKQGIPDEAADFYLFKIGKLMSAEDLDFEAAATKYLKANPIEAKQDNKTPMWGGGGSTKPTGKGTETKTASAFDALENKYK